MLKFTNTEVTGFAAALRGMRNPLNSWNKSDSFTDGNLFILGKNDLTLCKKLIKGGPEHRKFLRMINVSVDISNAPLYWLQEFDTYKIATTRNSCSLQHKGASRDFVLDDFTIDQPNSLPITDTAKVNILTNHIIDTLNDLRATYLNTKDYSVFRLMRQLMPCGINYKFTWACNYEVLYNIIQQRSHHRLREWHDFVDWIKTLPYAQELLF